MYVINTRIVVCLALLALVICTFARTYSNGNVSGKPTMYGRDSCPFCVKQKAALKHTGVYNRFRYVDVTTPNGAAEFKRAGGQGVPFFSYKGKVVSGYTEPAKLMKDLGI